MWRSHMGRMCCGRRRFSISIRPPTPAPKIGTFRASGPGTLNYVPDPKQAGPGISGGVAGVGRAGPAQRPAGADGRGPAEVGGDRNGHADSPTRFGVFLRELEVDGKMQPMPDRMNAIGQVEINSPELIARTRQLSASFRVEEPSSRPSPWPAAREAGNRAWRNSIWIAGAAGRRGQYQVQSDEMQLEVALRGKRAAPTTLSCNGNVAFREMAQATSSTARNRSKCAAAN